MAVDSYVQRMFGTDVPAFGNSKVLLVGAGGIGCELLKDLVMMNIGEIHVLDLDTIDLSNLNRQFLFRQKDIKQSKSKTAIKSVEFFAHKSKLFAYHGSILDKKTFPLSFFQQFNIIYNALDNLEARFYVNRMCLYLNIPLYESGTTGLKGQVQPIYPYLSECFSCVPKETPKTFPVCTIRSTPSKPVHCITWAKDFLFSQLFADGEEENVAAPEASEFTNKEEAKAVAEETGELGTLKKLIADSKFEDVEFVRTIFKKIFVEDVQRLIGIEELWKSRTKPSVTVLKSWEKMVSAGTTPKEERMYSPGCSDQNSLSDMITTFRTSLLLLSDRLRKGEPLEFDKDDQETLRFVMSASNIRSLIFHIPTKNEFDVKQIAGNIIPAVATMNATMAGFSALSSVVYYTESDNKSRALRSKMIFDSSSTDKVVNSSKLAKPNPTCSACSVVKGILNIDLETTKLLDLREALIEKYNYGDDVEIMTLDSRVLYDFDTEDNLDKNLRNFIEDQSVLLVGDSDEKLDLIELYVINTPNAELKLPDLNIPLKMVKTTDENEENDSGNSFVWEDELDAASSVVLDNDEDDLIIEEPPVKKRKLD